MIRGSTFVSVVALAYLALACGETPAPTVALSLTPSTIASGGTTRADVTVTDFELVAEDTAHTHTLASAHEAGGEEHEGDHEIVRSGHYHLYLDSLETNPIAMATEPSVELTITASTGAHKVIARLHGIDHRIIEPQVTAEATLTIE